MFANFAGALMTGVLLATTAASGEILHFRSTLAPCGDPPSRQSRAAGLAVLTLDTESKVLSWNITYSGLSGPVIAGGFKTPSAAGSAAAVMLDLAPDRAAPLPNPVASSARLSDIQIGHLRAGLWSINLITAKNPNGELRGDLERVP